MRHHRDMPERPLTRGEIAELTNRLQGLLAMVDEDELSTTTAMRYRLQGAVVALEAVLGRAPSLLASLDRT